MSTSLVHGSKLNTIALSQTYTTPFLQSTNCPTHRENWSTSLSSSSSSHRHRSYICSRVERPNNKRTRPKSAVFSSLQSTTCVLAETVVTRRRLQQHDWMMHDCICWVVKEAKLAARCVAERLTLPTHSNLTQSTECCLRAQIMRGGGSHG